MEKVKERADSLEILLALPGPIGDLRPTSRDPGSTDRKFVTKRAIDVTASGSLNYIKVAPLGTLMR